MVTHYVGTWSGGPPKVSYEPDTVECWLCKITQGPPICKEMASKVLEGKRSGCWLCEECLLSHGLIW